MYDALHFTSISLENVRAFRGRQTLELSTQDGTPSRWCLILGENGVGKTTLMQALAVMRPVPAFKRDVQTQSDGKEAGVPDHSEPELGAYENEEIQGFVRTGQKVDARLEAVLRDSAGELLELGYICRTDGSKLLSADPVQAAYALKGDGPLVIGYSASRHRGEGNLMAMEEVRPAASLFDEKVELVDANEMLEKLHYAALATGDPRDAARLEVLKAAIAALLDLDVSDIDLQGPVLPGKPGRKGGVHVTTPSGTMPLTQLSLGYQTMIAWTVDLTWRLFSAFPESDRPLSESAIVLIDEIDLHLHPRWQRSLRAHLTTHFPNVQFIATTHSPITAQEARMDDGVVAVVRWRDDESEISVPDGSVPMRIEELLTSEFFGFKTTTDVRTEDLLRERRDLLLKDQPSEEEIGRLERLNRFAEHLDHRASSYEHEFESLMNKVVTYEKTLAGHE